MMDELSAIVAIKNATSDHMTVYRYSTGWHVGLVGPCLMRWAQQHPRDLVGTLRDTSEHVVLRSEYSGYLDKATSSFAQKCVSCFIRIEDHP